MSPVFGVRLPLTHRELPPWVVPSLQMYAPHHMSLQTLAKNVDCYLENMTLHTTTSDSVSLLRRVNWANLPLVWRPMRLRNVPVTVGLAECRQSQRRLVDRIGSDITDVSELAEHEREAILAETKTLLHFLTGVNDSD